MPPVRETGDHVLRCTAGLVLALLSVLSAPLAAQPAAMTTGPAIAGFGPAARVDSDMPIPPDTMFRIAFDVSEENTTDRPLRGFESLARFINMHVAAGVPEDRIRLALVVHGKASFDLLTDSAHRARFDGRPSPSGALIADLQKHHVRVIVCGQSAAALGIAKADLMPGVELALSAMTAHALLQQEGYTLNPF